MKARRLHQDKRGWRAFVAFDHQLAGKTTLDVAHSALGIAFDVDHVAVTETDPLGNLLRPLYFPLLEEDTSSSPRNALHSDALTAAATWAKDSRTSLVAEDLNFTAKNAASQLSPKGTRLPSGLLYAKHRQLHLAKCFWGSVELIRLIRPVRRPQRGEIHTATRLSVHAAAADVVAHKAQKLTERRLPRPNTAVRVPVRGGHHALEPPARKSRESRVTVWRSVHAARRGMVREHWLAARCGSPRQSAKGTFGCSGITTPFSRGARLPCEDNLHVQICAHRNERQKVPDTIKLRRSPRVPVQAP